MKIAGWCLFAGWMVVMDAHGGIAPQWLFERDIRPILEQHCMDCHSGWFPDAGLSVETIESLKKGGRSGPGIVPGQPDKGWIPYVLQQSVGRFRMPPIGPRLSDVERMRILQWIEQGAR